MTWVDAVRILIVDDHPLIRDGLRLRLERQKGWSVCVEADSEPDAIRLVRNINPDSVIIGLSLKAGSGLGLIKRIAALTEAPKILVCSTNEDALYAQRAICAGAQGYLCKQYASQDVVKAIETILGGKLFLSDDVKEIVTARMMKSPVQTLENPIDQMTDRELDVLKGIGRGLTVRQMAEGFHLSMKTIETYRERAKLKLNLRTSAELVHYAIRWMRERGD